MVKIADNTTASMRQLLPTKQLRLNCSGIKRSISSRNMTKKFPILSKFVDRLLGMHDRSCGPERNWLVQRFTCHALDKVNTS